MGNSLERHTNKLYQDLLNRFPIFTFMLYFSGISLSFLIVGLVRMPFEGPLVAITWGIVAFGSYLMFCIIKHIKEKPPGAQTLLDGIHQQMLWIWMMENFMLLVMTSLVTWGFESYVTAWIFGYGTMVVIYLSSIHLMICVVTRIGLVFCQEAIENILEDHILIGVM